MTRLSYTLRKYPAARLTAFVLILVAGILVWLFATRNVTRIPTITSISPSIGTPGDVLVIRGENFGESRSSNYVELCGNRITESGYISWKNNEIQVVIPSNTGDGLLYVITRGGKSNPNFFTNELALPVYTPQNPTLNAPAISEVSPENPAPGQIIIITGKNFGASRENSAVYFSCRPSYTDMSNQNLLEQSTAQQSIYTPFASVYEGFTKPVEADFDYEYWSETEIRVRVPDGAQNGSFFVATENGQSAKQPLTIRRRVGEKTFSTRHTYLIQIESTVSEIKGGDGTNTSVILHMPHPIAYSQQPSIYLTETSPAPTVLNYKNTSIFQTRPTEEKNEFSAKQIFAVECNSVETTVYRDYVHFFNERDRALFKTYTNADEIVPADTPEMLELLPNIIFKVTNPYRRAELVFDYMVNNYKLVEKPSEANADPLDLVKKKRGDAYDFAAIYTALLRTAGIPARMISGILVNADMRTQNHWWCEFYLEDFGWVPVDVAIGAGLQFEQFTAERHPPRYYFGNIDAQHIAFSVNYNVIKQTGLNNKTVYFPRSYAAQSIWEESSADIEKYDSNWATPTVVGIY